MTKTVALTIAVGQEYRRMAARAADSVTRSTGLPTQVLTEAHVHGAWHPSFTRLWLFDLVDASYEAVLWFDADTYFCRPWDLTPLLQAERFCAALDLPSKPLKRECEEHGIAFRGYVNGGIFLAFRRQHVPLFALAAQIATSPQYRSKFLEQTALNAALQQLDVDVHYLPRECNAICRPGSVPERPIVLHRAGGIGNRVNVKVFERRIRESVCPRS